ncbi:hypothetical protein MKJ04_11650 [Pontibacter sp. E15-1]|uniref:hypothetical protein n=1 Tax=Pontibacter sp. E15-1 TaxID=2919918 RepID=UPI001F4FC993|nr:hypothetical protein [Pontibacter sp. E15-1]MCJ8165498.1 hypothetical protein [Pontibacter sp. E15-1]
MNVQFVSDERGEITAVQIPIEAWREIERKIKAVDASEWQGVSNEEIAAIEAGDRDFAEGRTLSNEEVLLKSRALRKKRA